MTRVVYLCEDHEIVIDGVTRILLSDARYDQIVSFKNAADLSGALQHRLPDILILDLNLPDTSGVELMPDLRRRYTHLPVLVLTMHKDQLLAAKLLRAGANGYLSKDFGEDELLAAMEKVVSGANYENPDFGEPILSSGNGHDKTYFLSRREKEIVQLTVDGLSSNDIAAKLFVSPHTVNTHRRNIYKKLGLQNVKELITFAHTHDIA